MYRVTTRGSSDDGSLLGVFAVVGGVVFLLLLIAWFCSLARPAPQYVVQPGPVVQPYGQQYPGQYPGQYVQQAPVYIQPQPSGMTLGDWWLLHHLTSPAPVVIHHYEQPTYQAPQLSYQAPQPRPVQSYYQGSSGGSSSASRSSSSSKSSSSSAHR